MLIDTCHGRFPVGVAPNGATICFCRGVTCGNIGIYVYISPSLANSRNDSKKYYAFYTSIVGHCISRKYEGGCLNYETDGLLLQQNYGVFTIQDCYEKCFAYNGCHGFFLNKDNSACDLYKQGCIRRIDSPQYWDYYEMDDCKGISSFF